MSTYSSKLPIEHVRENTMKTVEEYFLQGNQYMCCWCNTKGTVQNKQEKSQIIHLQKQSTI